MVGIGPTHVAIPLIHVVEVHRAVALTALRRGPVSVEGVINVRGDVVPVVDLRERLGLPHAALSADQHLVLVRAAERTLAVRVDTVDGLAAIDSRTLRPADLPGLRRVAGLAATPDGVVIVCDLLDFLDWDEASRLDAAMQAAGARS